MNGLLLVVLIPLHFTAPADTLGMDAAGRARLSPVHEYVFQQLDANGKTTVVPGYADSVGSAILTPHAPGTRETVWLAPGANGSSGYDATVAALTPDSLIDLLSDGVPPILLYRDGSEPAAPGHFGVVTEWDASQASFTLNDGTAHRRVTRRDDLVKQWTLAGSQALIVRERAR